jgi:micrococcal nuclease
MKNLPGVLVALALTALGGAASASEAYEGRVYYVADGDTLRMLYQGGQIRVRLEGVDAPERCQPHGAEARAALADRVLDRVIRVEGDRWERGHLVGRVTVDGLDVAREMVAQGHAWVLPGAAEEGLGALQAKARRQASGLWGQASPVAPWEWRSRSVAASSGEVGG